MRFLPLLPLLLCAGCAAHLVSNPPAPARLEHADRASSPSAAQPVAPVTSPGPGAGERLSPEAAGALAGAAAREATSPEAAEAIEDGGEEDSSAAEVEGFDSTEGDEAEAPDASGEAGALGPQYTRELSDEELERQWKEEPSLLGSISVGFVHSGRMVNSVRFPASPDWLVVSPDKAYATQETIDYLTRAIRELRARYPDAPLLRINQISARDGGYLRPHKSHQNGRDVDLGFYYPNGNVVRARERERYIDPLMNWALIRALVTHTDVQVILVDRRVQKVLYEHAVKIGEDKGWLDSLFHAGERSLIKHARGHRDHFHVRFFNPRAQELGRRIAPLLALQPEHNLAMHRVRSGDTLGAIAMRYNSTVSSIRNANRIRGTLLRIGQVLSVPLRGPCTRCPVPPPVVIPPRLLPVELQVKAAVKEEPLGSPAPTTTAAEIPGS